MGATAGIPALLVLGLFPTSASSLHPTVASCFFPTSSYTAFPPFPLPPSCPFVIQRFKVLLCVPFSLLLTEPHVSGGMWEGAEDEKLTNVRS